MKRQYTDIEMLGTFDRSSASVAQKIADGVPAVDVLTAFSAQINGEKEKRPRAARNKNTDLMNELNAASNRARAVRLSRDRTTIPLWAEDMEEAKRNRQIPFDEVRKENLAREERVEQIIAPPPSKPTKKRGRKPGAKSAIENSTRRRHRKTDAKRPTPLLPPPPTKKALILGIPALLSQIAPETIPRPYNKSAPVSTTFHVADHPKALARLVVDDYLLWFEAKRVSIKEQELHEFECDDIAAATRYYLNPSPNTPLLSLMGYDHRRVYQTAESDILFATDKMFWDIGGDGKPEFTGTFYPFFNPASTPDTNIETGLNYLREHGRYLRVVNSLPGDGVQAGVRPFTHGSFRDLTEWMTNREVYERLADPISGPSTSLYELGYLLDDRLFANDLPEGWQSLEVMGPKVARILAKLSCLKLPPVPLSNTNDDAVFNQVHYEVLAVRLAEAVAHRLITDTFYLSPINDRALIDLITNYVNTRYFRLRRIEALLSSFCEYLFTPGLWNKFEMTSASTICP